MADTKIEWSNAVWNPATGCDKVSPGCGLPRFDGDDTGGCYAMAMAKRLKAMGQAKYQNDGDPRTSGPGFGVTLHPDVLDQPLRWKRSRRIFVNSMSDLFHDAVPDDYIEQVFDVMETATHHTFQLLTKRHARMKSFVTRRQQGKEDYALAFENNPVPERRTCPAAVFARKRADNPPANIWLGVSAEDQKWWDIRWTALRETPAAVRFVSAEPLLGGIAMGWPHPSGPDWLIIGGESGPGAREMRIGWARDLVAQCADYGIAPFVKQLGSVLGRELGAGPKGGDWDAWPEDLRVREFPHAVEPVTA